MRTHRVTGRALAREAQRPGQLEGQQLVGGRHQHVAAAVHDGAQPVAVAGAEGGEVSLFDWDEIGNRIAALSRGG